MLRELGRSLAQAISASDDIHQAVRRFHRRGFTLQLRLDCHHEDEERGAGIQLSSASSLASGGESEDCDPPAGALPATVPEFRLEGDDVAFLRCLGIDPTRPAPRRR